MIEFLRPHKHIHKVLKKHHPEAVKKAKRIFSFKYPKLTALIFLIILSYYLFTQPVISEFVDMWGKMKYIGILFAGILVSFGFSAPFGVGLLTQINNTNILLGAVLGGIGASLGDLIIFKTIKWSFIDEFNRLKETKVAKKIREIVKEDKHILIKHYLLYIFAGIMIVTPLPDEIGVSMLAGLTTINEKKLAVISFILHTSAIFLILYFF